MAKAKKMQVLIADRKNSFSAQELAHIQKGKIVFFPHLQDKFWQCLSPKVYAETNIIAPNPDLVGWELPNDILEKFPNLQAICLPTTSTEMLDLAFCQKRKVIVTNVPQYSTEAVAEYAIWMMMSLARKLPLMFTGQIDDYNDQAIQTEVRGKVAGIIGLGNIGRRIAEFCDRIGMKVLYYSPSLKDTFFEKSPLRKLLSRSDFIFPTYSVNTKTKKLLDKSILQLLKKDSYLISVIGGPGVIDINYLKQRVLTGKLAGLAYESSVKEMFSASDKKFTKGNVFTPPPFAWYSAESLTKCYQEWSECIASVGSIKAKNQVI